MRAWVVVCLVGCLANLAGCGGGEGKPIQPARTPEERRDAAMDPGQLGFWEPLIEQAVKELAASVAQRGSDQRPIVRVGPVRNLTTAHVDVGGVARRLEASLEASGRFEVIDAGTWEAADQAPELAPGEAAEMRLSGELGEQRTDARRTLTLTLTLVNARDRGLVARSRQKAAIVRAE